MYSKTEFTNNLIIIIIIIIIICKCNRSIITNTRAILEILTEEKFHIAFFWVMTLYSLAECNIFS
jgi:uncharacterized membrane protein YgaE (UPF0421/DUF939 family)